MNFRTYFFISVISFFSIDLICQVQFTNSSNLLAQRDMHSAVPVAIADMNGDGLDDIVTMNEGTRLFVQYQTPDPERPFVRYDLPTNIDIDTQNDICVADFNNDGANDIFTIGSYDRAKILYGIPFTYDFNLVYVNVVPFFSQGASTGDFNGDGWVDVVILNDNGLNYSLMNDGSGTLVSQDFFNFVTVPPSDNSGNYGSVYTDFDMDGDNDFYIAKCRQGVNSSSDPRRINVLFVNDGDNNYTENAAAYGLASGRQTWSTDFGDIDNDGDQDVFMTQHDVISELYENIDNDTFINITSSAGLNIGGIPLQGMFRDFDNDGFQDILVSGDRIDYFHNNGDNTFTRQEPFANIVFGSFALGDLNSDGFTDVYASRVIPFNNPDLLRPDILFLNNTNDNHFVSLQLEAGLLNSSAIGATATLYSNLGIQIREVRGGEQYGVSNAHSMIFGLGQETSYDSLVIRWPDGSKERFNELSIDQSWTIHRGGCITTSDRLWQDLQVICGTDSIVLKVDGHIGAVQWSTGSFSDSIIVKETGLYFASYPDENNCPTRTIPLEVITDPDTIKPVITYGGNLELCNGDVATLSLPAGTGYQWSSGQTEQSINVTETGQYFAAVQGFCKSLQSDTISLNFLVPEAPVTENDTFKLGESANLMASGDNIVWTADPFGIYLLGTGPDLQLNNLTKTTTFYAHTVVPLEGQDFQLGPITQQGNTKYNAAFVNGGLIFEVLEPIFLESFTVYTDSAGTRSIQFSYYGDLFYEHQVDLDSGATEILLNLSLPVGEYTVGTNTDINNQVFGESSPYLWRSSEDVLYPYEISGVVSITNSTFGEDFYYYFYNWKVSTEDRYCSSAYVPATAVLDMGVGIHDPIADHYFQLFPNPTNGLTQLLITTELPVELELTNLYGNILNSKTNVIGNYTFDLTPFPAGIFILRLKHDGRMYTKRIVKL